MASPWFLNDTRVAGIIAFEPEFVEFRRPDGEMGARMRFLLDIGSKKKEVRLYRPQNRRVQIWVKCWGKVAMTLHRKGVTRGDNVHVWGYLEHFTPKGRKYRIHSVVARMVRLIQTDKFRKGYVQIKTHEYHWIKSKLEQFGADLDVPPEVLAEFGLHGEDMSHGNRSDDQEYGDPGDDLGDFAVPPGFDLPD